jgi:hypothetical protein
MTFGINLIIEAICYSGVDIHNRGFRYGQYLYFGLFLTVNLECARHKNQLKSLSFRNDANLFE